MSAVVDVTADLPRLADLLLVRDLTPEEVAPLAEELATYHQHFAPFFSRREQREWAEVYLRGLLTADVPRKNVEAMALRLLGVGPHAERQVRALQQFIGEGAWDDEAILAEHQRQVDETDGARTMACSTLSAPTFPSMGGIRWAWRPSGAATPARRITARRGSFWAMPAAKVPPCLTGACTCRSPGLVRITRSCGRPAGFPKGPPAETKHELAAQLVEEVMADVRLPARWVVCDEGYGDAPAFLARLAEAGLW